MRHRQEAVLFPRRYRLKNGKRIVVWWYYVTTDGGKRLRFSLATSSRTEARYLLDQKIKGGKLIPIKPTIVRLEDFARDFWIWDRCTYIKGRLLRGERISRRWAQQCRGYLEHHILPALGSSALTDIGVGQIERFLFALKEQKGLSKAETKTCLFPYHARPWSIRSGEPADGAAHFSSGSVEISRLNMFQPENQKLLFPVTEGP